MLLVVIKTIIPVPARAAIVVVPAIKEWLAIKQSVEMKTYPNRDLLVLLKNELMSPWAIEREVELLNTILRTTELPQEFCKAHELIRRNRITQKTQKLLNAFHQTRLKPFWFLISKN